MTEIPAIDILEKNQHIISVVRDTTCHVFSTMLGLSVTHINAKVEKRATVPTEGIVAMVGMAGAVSGNGCVCFSKKFACQIASRFLMAEYDEVNDDVLDAAAEIGNMVIGGLKTLLEDEMGVMGLSVPTVVFGDKYVTRSPSLGDRMVLTFICEELGEEFSILICLIPANQNRSYLRELAEFHARLT
ncbi:MAG TPA: chemotaxis protein CheX [Bryobacteraceae bacterium]|jgi:chemotaxis protein CheX|nr:chemotaxis protein CheX [Bryobacteraceae bacterium]